MNSLLTYGSDDDLNESGDEGYPVEPRGAVSRNYRKPVATSHDDTNYEEVQMSLSEDSDSETNNKKSKEDRGHSRDRDTSGSKDFRRNSRDDRHSRDDDRYTRDEDRSKHRDREDKDDSRNRSRDDDRSRDRYVGDREDDRGYRERRDDKRGRSKDTDRSREDRYSRDRRDRDRRRSRSRSRDRRRSRSPKRSRSRSRDRTAGRGSYYRKYDRSNRDRFDNRNTSKPDTATQPNVEESQPKDRFFMPGITGRFRDQIEKRKLLWQKGKEAEKVEQAPVVSTAPSTSSKTTKVWETTTFAQDSDGKVANKFKRLMGIKNPIDTNKVTTEVLKKQEEMFSSMEAQYEVARTATHTMRGVGLGFGSFQR